MRKQERQFPFTIPIAFVSPRIASGLHVFVALLGLVRDRRIERVLVKRERE